MTTAPAAQAAPKKFLVQLTDKSGRIISAVQVEAFDETFAKLKAVIAFTHSGVDQTSDHGYLVKEISHFSPSNGQLTLFGFAPEKPRTSACAFRLTVSTAECNDCNDVTCFFNPERRGQKR